jgi:hypothetical protein
MNDASGFQRFEFRFGSFKFFRIKAAGLCKNWRVATSVNVMLNPMLASHPWFSKWREIFEAKFGHLQALNLGLAALGWGQKPAKRGRVGP